MSTFAWGFVVALVALLVGTALGRVKNRAKLAAVQAEIQKIDNEIMAGAKTLAADVVARVKKLL